MKPPIFLRIGLGLLVLVVHPAVPAAGPGSVARAFEEAKSHWAYQPIRRPNPPAVKATDRVWTPVDAFLLARLEAEGLGYSPLADARTRLRRVYFDLIGLPPTFEEVSAFERDASPTAYRAVVERLLASPRYGERWGRHWLDVARYADTKDLVLLYGRDALRPWAYTYRDYVIRAFNDDLPFDRFVEDQLAADLVEPAVPRWRLAGLGFLTLGRLFDNNPHDQIDDQIDTVSRGLLGLTVGCARCHDHKTDALTMADYYGLYGVFASTERPYVLPLIEDPVDVPDGAEFEARLAAARRELEDHIDREFARLGEVLRGRFGDYLVRAATTQPDLTETSQFGLSLTPEDFRPALVLNMRRFLAERVKAGDRVFGPWAELMALGDDGFSTGARAVVADLRERSASSTEPLNGLILAGLAEGPLERREDVPRIYARVVTNQYALARARRDGAGRTAGAATESRDARELVELVTGNGGPMWFPRRDTPDHMSRAEKDKYGGLVLNLDKMAAHATNPPPARAMVVVDLPAPKAPRIFVRGSPSRLGEEVPRGFLRVLNGGQAKPFASSSSGRLELAREIVSPGNPLTARVMVNRVWMQHFGEPLVATTTDFGSRTEPPTHPQLLDWLADEFRRAGWSWKHLHRQIVLSAAFQQSGADRASATFASAVEADPDARWLWHYPRRRLDLEAMRDAMLSVSGRLDLTMGGRPVDLAGDAGNGRRTVYGLIDRQNLPGLYRSFDFASPDQCVERRPRTTVAQQALFALNSPFVLEQARSLAARVGTVGDDEPEGAIGRLFRVALGRHPAPPEVSRARRFLAEARTAAPGGPSPLEQLAQVLLVGNEALFLD